MSPILANVSRITVSALGALFFTAMIVAASAPAVHIA